MDWITLAEAKKLFPAQISVNSIRSMVDRGQLRMKRFSPRGRIFVYRPDVEALVATPDPVEKSYTDTPLPGF